MNPTLLRARSVVKGYGKAGLHVEVLHGVAIDLRAGELALLMGPSGSGKTTLVSICAGMMRADAGTVEVCGREITGLPDPEVAKVRRRHLGFVFQDASLFPALTALDNVAEVVRMKTGVRMAAARLQATRMLDSMRMGHRLRHRPDELSGGERQRVAIARALAGDPDLLMGDEVTAALDGHSARLVMELVRGVVEPRRGVLLVTHDRRLEAFADRVIRLEDGRVVGDDPGGWTGTMGDGTAAGHGSAAQAALHDRRGVARGDAGGGK